MAENQTTHIPTSCGEAWMKYYNDPEQMIPRGGFTEAMQAAFDAGWDACFAAFVEVDPDVHE